MIPDTAPYLERHWLEYGEDFTVTDIEEQDTGGRLTLLVSLPPEAEQIVIRRKTPRTQEIDLHNGARIPAELIETIGDKITMLVQEISEQVASEEDIILLREAWPHLQRSDLAQQQAINDEIQAREQGDAETLLSANIHADNSVSQTNDNLQALQNDFNAWIGRGGYLDAYDFGTHTPEQTDLTNYALSQIPSISSPEQIWNGTKVVNLNNMHLWIITNTQDTDPPVLEWADQGPGDLAAFSANMGGYIVGGDPSSDGPEYVFSQMNGKGKVNLEAIVNMLFDIEHPVGDVVTQMPGAPSPIDKQWRGDWRKWNDRANQYRLRQTAIPSYSIYAPNANYAANTVVMWHLPGDDYGFFKAKDAITAASNQLDPIKWDQLKEGDIVDRQDMLDVNPWLDNDLAIGSQIVGGEYDGYWIEEVLVYGGKFFACDGGNRPPFGDGTAGDAIRNITGSFGDTFTAPSIFGVNTGVFSIYQRAQYECPAFTGSNYSNTYWLFNLSQVVPTGPENSGRTASSNEWRRVA